MDMPRDDVMFAKENLLTLLKLAIEAELVRP